jgi:hypothetical protein
VRSRDAKVEGTTLTTSDGGGTLTGEAGADIGTQGTQCLIALVTSAKFSWTSMAAFAFSYASSAFFMDMR